MSALELTLEECIFLQSIVLFTGINSLMFKGKLGLIVSMGGSLVGSQGATRTWSSCLCPLPPPCNDPPIPTLGPVL